MKKTFSIIYIIMKNKIYLNKFNFVIKNKKRKKSKIKKYKRIEKNKNTVIIF